jgi:DNA-binding response OmpR family regulator
VWIVEDDRVVRGALALQLAMLGVRHAFATRRHELEALHHRDGAWPDAVVVDDMLGPYESGLDIALWLRQCMEPERIVVVTGNVEPHRLRALDGTGVRVLRKPVAAGDLVLWFRTLGARSSPAGVPAR